MIKEIERNLLIIQSKTQRTLQETMDKIFQDFYKDLLRFKKNEVLLAQFYSSSFFNECLTRELQYLNEFFSQDLKNFLNEIIISPN